MGTVSQVGTATTTSNTSSLTPSVTGTWGTGQTRTALNLLVAVVTGYGNNTAYLGDSPAGWALFDMGHGAIANGTNIAAVYFKTAAGTDAAPVFTAVMTGTAADCRLDVTLYEYTDSGGGTPVLSTSGTAVGTSGTTLSTTSRLSVLTGSAALAVITVSQGTTAATATWTPPSGWTAGPNITASFRAQFAIWTLAAPTAGSALSVALPHGRTTTTLLAGLILVISPSGSTQPQYIDAHSSISLAGATSSTGATWTHTSTKAGSALVVGTGCGATGAMTWPTVTCDGTAMTSLTTNEQPGTAPGDGGSGVQLWGLANLSSGAHTIVVKPSITADVMLTARTIAGADSSSPFGTGSVAQGTGGTVSATKTGTAGNLILYASISGTAIGSGPNGTAYRTYGKSLNGSTGGGNSDHGVAVATGSSQTVSTLIGSDDWAIALVEILPGSGSASVPLTESGAGTDALTLSSAVGLVDAGVGADALGIMPGLTDSGAGTDTLAIAIPVALTESGAGSVGLGIMQGLAESGTGTDALSLSASLAFTDTGTGSDGLGIMPGLSEAGTGTDGLGILPGLSESGAGTDALSIASTVPLTESGTGIDGLGIMPGLKESGSGTDALAISIPVGLTDTGAGSAGLGVMPGLTETGAGSDALSISLVDLIGLTDAGTGADSLGIMPGLAEAGSGADALKLTAGVGLTDAGVGRDALALSAGVALSEAGAGSETIGVMPGLVETGTGSDALGIVSVTIVGLLETGAGSDALTIQDVTIVSLTESGTGTTTLHIHSDAPVEPACTFLAQQQIGAVSLAQQQIGSESNAQQSGTVATSQQVIGSLATAQLQVGSVGLEIPNCG